MIQSDGRSVRRLGFGALRLLGPNGFGPPRSLEASVAVLKAASVRVDLIDTADCYGPELSETMIAETLFPYREGLIIATKGGMTCPGPGEWIPRAAPDRLRRCCNESLARLRLDQIHLYQLHTVDPTVEFEKSIEAIAELHEEGLIRQVGLCNVTSEQLVRARRIVTIASVQNRFNLNDTADGQMVDECAAADISFIPWFPLKRGSLADLSNEPLASVAAKYSTTPAQVALAWLLARSPTLLPIPGTSSMEHLVENCAATTLILDAEDIDLLGRKSQRPPLGHP